MDAVGFDSTSLTPKGVDDNAPHENQQNYRQTKSLKKKNNKILDIAVHHKTTDSPATRGSPEQILTSQKTSR